MGVSGHQPFALSGWELGVVSVGLVCAAMLAPLPLYLVALTLFGLPHVLWELHWIRQTYRLHIPNGMWLAWWGILGIQASSRLGAWAGWVTVDLTLLVDVLTLVVLLWVAAGMAWRAGTLRAGLLAGLAVGLGAALLWVVEQGDVIGVLVLLAIVHNFTPLLLVAHGQHFSAFPARTVLLALFSLPVLVMILLLLAGMPAPETTGWWMPSEASWLQQHLPSGFAAALSALVLAQCLHYYSVIRLLPTTLAAPAGRFWLWGVLAVSLSLTVYFMTDFKAARQLYAVAAGVHAWLEFPLILLLLSGLGIGTEQADSPKGII